MKQFIIVATFLNLVVAQSALAQFTSCRIDGQVVEFEGRKVFINNEVVKAGSRKSKFGRIFSFTMNEKDIAIDIQKLEKGEAGVIGALLTINDKKSKEINCNGSNAEPELGN